MAAQDRGINFVETKYFSFSNPLNEFFLESGEKFGPITLAYETYGELNEEKSNAILVLHALSGDAHVAGFHKGENDPGWWDAMVGPGKGLDTEKYFVICSNILGGCKGSTGPSSINPRTNKQYGLDFPIITVKDIVNAQCHLINHLGIHKLLTVIGGSMGGMQVLQWAVSYPDRICSAIPIATALKHEPQQIAFNEVGRQAIMADPNWEMGNYYGHSVPAKGLSVARMIGHITYMSDISMGEKFGRNVKANKEQFKFSPEFEVEGYLKYRGDNFVKRFDANSYLYITKAIDRFDLLNGKKLGDVFKALKAKILVIAFKSDWLYPAYQSLEIVKACKLAGVDSSYCEISSTYGHDAFLLEIEEESQLIRDFLKTVSKR
ncbi:MAG: homoserine O-acetyltransferase/O-succinyltransferase [Thermoproteota archaeon]|nr:homoserine O-acetyltransferase/O-succinyltransferase [Thermoproteota archaeon]